MGFLSGLFGQDEEEKKFEEEQGKDFFIYEKVPAKTSARLDCIIDELYDKQTLSSDNFAGIVSHLFKKNTGGTIYDLWRDDSVLLSDTSIIRRAIAKLNPPTILQLLEVVLETVLRIGGQGAQKFCDDVNEAFRRDHFGYELNFENRRFFRIDKNPVYRETVKKAINILNDKQFALASEEYWKALDAYTRGAKEWPAAIREANNAFESTMKIILGVKSGNADFLIKELIRKEFLPQYQEKFCQTLLGLLPVMRDNLSKSHGQGDKKVEVEEEDVRFAISLAGAYIVYIVSKCKPR